MLTVNNKSLSNFTLQIYLRSEILKSKVDCEQKIFEEVFMAIVYTLRGFTTYILTLLTLYVLILFMNAISRSQLNFDCKQQIFERLFMAIVFTLRGFTT